MQLLSLQKQELASLLSQQNSSQSLQSEHLSLTEQLNANNNEAREAQNTLDQITILKSNIDEVSNKNQQVIEELNSAISPAIKDSDLQDQQIKLN